MQWGVCDHCARLFRTPIEGTAADNRTMMFHHLPFPRPVAPAPRIRKADARSRFRTYLGRVIGRLRRFVFPRLGGTRPLTPLQRQK